MFHSQIWGLGHAGGGKVHPGLQAASLGQSKGRPEPVQPSQGQRCDAGQDCLEKGRGGKDKKIVGERDRDRDGDRERQRERERKKERKRDRQTERQKQADRQTDRDRQRERQKNIGEEERKSGSLENRK